MSYRENPAGEGAHNLPPMERLLSTAPSLAKQDPLMSAKGPFRPTQGPLDQQRALPDQHWPPRPTEYSLGQTVGLYRPIDGSCGPLEYFLRSKQGPLRPTRDLVRPAKDRLEPHRTFLSQSQVCSLIRPATGTLQANSGPAEVDKGPSEQHEAL